MKKPKNLIILAFVLLIVGISTAYFLNQYIKNQIILGLEKEFPSSALSYDEISVNVLAGNSSISNLLLNKNGVHLAVSRVKIRDFSYNTYLRTGNFEIGRLELIEPDIIINKGDTIQGSRDPEKKNEKNLFLKKIIVKGGSLKVIENDSAVNDLFVSIKKIELEKVLFGKKNNETLLPFEYSSYQFESDSLYYNLNTWNAVTIQKIQLKKDLKILDFRLLPKLSRAKFDQSIPYEKDWIALKVDEIFLKDFEWGKVGDSLLISSPETNLRQANLQIYRNKLITDDTRIKPMYSEMLRSLGVKLRLDSIAVKNAGIVYEEKVLENRPPARINFENIHAGVKNLTNIKSDDGALSPTHIKAEALLMGNSRLTLNWKFNVSNPGDEFQVWGSLAEIKAEAMNPFLKHSMNVETKGQIESLSYNFYGNRDNAAGDMKMAYRNFKVQILKNGEEKTKSFFSSIANLIIKNEAVNDDITQEQIEVQRDKTKSFWNFLWRCIRDGAIKTFI